MAYCTYDDLIPAVIAEAKAAEMTSEDGEVNEDIVNAAIDDSAGEMNSYIGKAYTIPLPTAVTSDPDASRRLREVNLDMAKYRLHKRRAAEVGIPEDVRKGYEDCLAWLGKVANRTVTLGITPAPAMPPSEGAQFGANDRMFSKGSMNGF